MFSLIRSDLSRWAITVRLTAAVLSLLWLNGCARFFPSGEKAVTTERLELHGAGATFPAPLYERWIAEFSRPTDRAQVTYDGVGTGAGIEQFTQELVDFAGSDQALSDTQMAKVDRGARMIPVTAGAVVLVYNLRDAQGQPVSDLRLSREALAGIFLGTIQRWNDPLLADCNPGWTLPDQPIHVEYRLDASGTTLAVTSYLSAISPQWREGPGVGLDVAWPVGAGMPKDAGVLRGVRQVDGAIGYVSFGYAAKEKAPMVALENRAGQYVRPTIESIQSALQDVGTVPEDLRLSVDDPSAAQAYPIVTYNYLLCYRTYDDPDRLKQLKEFLTYCLGPGQSLCTQLSYAPLPPPVAAQARLLIDKISLPQSADAATTAAPSSAAVPATAAASPTAAAPTRQEIAAEAAADESAAGKATTNSSSTNSSSPDGSGPKAQSPQGVGAPSSVESEDAARDSAGGSAAPGGEPAAAAQSDADDVSGDAAGSNPSAGDGSAGDGSGGEGSAGEAPGGN
ncbi:MAG: phosphate ABC transporter substrate-binding protein PstS [Pirellulales bacterium]